MRHITFDEMTEVIFADKASPEIQSLSDKINSHILFCDQCYETYSRLLQLKETLEVRAARLCADDPSPKLLHALCALCASDEGNAEAVYEVFDNLNGDIENLRFKITGGKMELLYGTSPFIVLKGVSEKVLVTKGFGGQTTLQEGCPAERISFRKGKVNICIPKRGYSADDVLFVVSDELEAPFCALLEENEGCLRAEISCPNNGEYTVMVGKGCKKFLSGSASTRQKNEEKSTLNAYGRGLEEETELSKAQRVEQRVRNWNNRMESDNTIRLDLTRLNNAISAAAFKENGYSYGKVGFGAVDFKEEKSENDKKKR